ncbi:MULTISPECIES: flagellar filament capping protein FliD [Roseateles]|uniref:Flagellar hook-associated protein 2 n=1 Tax=Pelomonas caseinilytica TaxID=2906763 RepID=A0ABS8XBV7_9BURK|nr:MULTISPECIES: flagellar filament capping protein FliD [unclassified Roseateles]MCE4538427.1 flagellar filament capping protein FliD [Pelomonas sp. P7]HEV6963974.1 flagellar filament capping protein FliD [Roseateles sp.]
MATITSLGIGSGLDVESIITKLMAVEQQPINNLNKKTDGLKTQLSTYGQIQSTLSTLRDAAAKLTNPDTWAGTKTTSSDATAITASASTGAAIGNVSISVSQLAAAQTLASSTFTSSTATVGQGSMTIELGSWATDTNGVTSFTSKPDATPVTITIGPGQDQLGQIRDQINASGAGVTAAIVTDATGSRLTLTSRNTGETNAFRVTVNDADGNGGDASGLSQLAYDPSNSVSQMSLSLPAANARAILNGLPISSESNLLASAIDGLNITLLRTTPPVNISVSQDADAIKKAVSDFTTAYNAVNQLLRNQTKYDAASKTAAPLQGDSTAVGLNNRLRGIAGGSTSLSTSLHRLADIGLAPGSDGNLPTAGAKLDKAMSNLADLKQFFMAVDNTNDGNSGFATQIRNLVDQALSVDGSVSSRQKGIQGEIDNNNKRVDDLNLRASSTETRLRAQYSALDTKMSQFSSLSNYLTQQLASLNK